MDNSNSNSLPLGLPQAQGNVIKGSVLDDYSDFIRKPAEVSDAELEAEFAASGIDIKAMRKEQAVKSAEANMAKQILSPEKPETPTQTAQKEIGGPAEPAKVVGAGLAGIVERVTNAAIFAKDYISQFAERSGGFPKSERVDFSTVVPQPDTPAGQVTKNVIEYSAPLAGLMFTGVGQTMAAGAAYDFMSQDPNGKNLSNFAQEVPWMRNPLSAALAVKPGEAEGVVRGKAVIEGALIQALGIGLGKGVMRGMGAVRNNWAKKTAEVLVQGMEAEKSAKSLFVPEEQLAAAEAKMGANAVEIKQPETAQLSFQMEEDLKNIPKVPEATMPKIVVQGKSIEEMSKTAGFNLENLNTTQDVQRFIAQFANDNREAIDALRPTTTFVEAQAEAEKLLQSDEAIADMLKRGLTPKEAKDTMAVQIVAHRILLVNTSRQLMDTAQQALTTGDKYLKTKVLDLFDKYRMVHFSMRPLQTEAASATSLGRLMVQHDIPIAGRMKMIDEALKLSGGEQSVDDMIAQLTTIKNIPDMQFVEKTTGEIAKASLNYRLQHAIGYAASANLMGVRSVLNAIAGNISNLTLGNAANFLGAGIGAVRRSENGLRFRDAGREIYGQMMGIQELFVGAGKSLLARKNMMPGIPIETKIDLPLRGANPLNTEYLFGYDSSKSIFAKIFNGAGIATGLPMKLIMPADYLTGFVAWRGRQHANAMALAEAKGLLKDTSDIGKQNLSKFMDSYAKIIDTDATAFAEEITLSKSINNIPGVGKVNAAMNEAPIARALFPFFKMTVNDTLQVLKYSPFALASSRIAEKSPKEVDRILGAMGVGMAGTAFFTYLAHNGMVTGDTPQNPTMYRALKAKDGKWQPNSIKIGGNYYSLDKLGPLGAFLKMGAFLNSVQNYVSEEEYQQLVIAGIKATVDSMTPENYIHNVGETMTALAELVDTSKDSKAAEKLLLEFTKRMTPLGGVQTQLARSFDPVIPSKEAYTTGMGSIEAFFAKAKVLLQGRTPIWSKDVPPDVSVLGRVQLAPGGWKGLLNPFASSPDSTDPLEQQLVELSGFSEDMRPIDPDFPVLKLEGQDNVIANTFDGYPFQLTPQESFKYKMYSAGIDPDTGFEFGPSGSLYNVMSNVINKIGGKKELSEIYMEKNGPLKVKDMVGEITRAYNQYREFGQKYLKNDSEVYRRMDKEFRFRQRERAGEKK